MSRVGNRPIKIDETVNIVQDNGAINLSSTTGKLRVTVPDEIKVEIKDGNLYVNRTNDSKFARSQHGLIARLLDNAIKGLTGGCKKVLEFKGTGYRARVEDKKLILNMGFSHEMSFIIPEELQVSVVKNSIIIGGVDAAQVGNFAASVREVRPPEVYKGKGIKYHGELIKRKDGKVASKG